MQSIGGRSISLGYGRFFAEFLNKGSLVHLRLLAQSTCVGFSTDTIGPAHITLRAMLAYTKLTNIH